jgi:hypothetical protein
MNKLDEAIAVIKAGDIERGRRLLVEVLDEDPRNAKAWLWMSGVVSDPERRRQSLLAVLEIEPDNEIARRGLEKFGWLEEEPLASIPPEPEAAEFAYEPARDEGPAEPVAAWPVEAADEEDWVAPAAEEEQGEFLSASWPSEPEEEALVAAPAPLAQPETRQRVRFTWLVIALLLLLLVAVLIVAALM